MFGKLLLQLSVWVAVWRGFIRNNYFFADNFDQSFKLVSIFFRESVKPDSGCLKCNRVWIQQDERKLCGSFARILLQGERWISNSHFFSAFQKAFKALNICRLKLSRVSRDTKCCRLGCIICHLPWNWIFSFPFATQHLIYGFIASLFHNNEQQKMRKEPVLNLNARKRASYQQRRLDMQ